MNDYIDYIEYAIPTNSDHWTYESDEVPAEFFERIERELTAFVASHWPDVVFTTRLVPEDTSFNNRSRTSFDDEHERGILAAIDDWMSNRWPDWLSEYVYG